MEIAFFSDSYAPLKDGVASEVQALARELRRQGHGVTVFAPEPRLGAAPRDEVIDGVSVVRCRALPVPRYPQLRWALFPFARLAGRRFGSRIQVVHIHTPGLLGTAGFLAARRYRLPVVGTFHTDVYAARESFGPHPLVRLFFWAARWYTLGLYYRCASVTVPTEPARAALLKHARKPFRGPVPVVPNGIELGRFRPGLDRPDWRGRYGIGPEPLVLFLGRLTRDKGIHRLLDAVAALPPTVPAAVLVGGTGPEELPVRERIANDPRLRSRVRFVGVVPEEEKAAFLAQGDLFVLPSTSDTSSVAVLEAMASGLPCLVTDVGGPRMLVEDGVSGRVVPAEPAGALAEGLAELLRAPELRARLRRGALARVAAEGSIETTARRFISLYGLVGAGGGSADGPRVG